MESSRRFKQAQLKQMADELVETAIREKPEYPGPLNPQTLAIKALTHMRDFSPLTFTVLLPIWTRCCGWSRQEIKAAQKAVKLKPKSKNG